MLIINYSRVIFVVLVIIHRMLKSFSDNIFFFSYNGYMIFCYMFASCVRNCKRKLNG